jgi:hypothetical protein
VNGREPLATAATITGAVAAVLALVVAFGVNLTGDQQTAILGVASVAAPLIVALVVRPKVTPVADPRLPGDVINATGQNITRPTDPTV